MAIVPHIKKHSADDIINRFKALSRDIINLDDDNDFSALHKLKENL